MNQGELRRLWMQNKDRPAWVRERREEINEHVSTKEPVPDGSLHDVRRWLGRFKGTVTRQLTPDDEDDDAGDGGGEDGGDN